VTAIRAGVPLELDRILAKALAKNPAHRYQHVDDLVVDLRTLRAGAIGPAPPSYRRWLVAAPGIVLLALISFAVWQSLRPAPPASRQRAVPVTTLPGTHRHPSFSPEGNQIAFAWTGHRQDNLDVYVQQIGAGGALRLTTDPANDYNPVWSPDGRWIAFLRGQQAYRGGLSGAGELRLVPPLSGPEVKLVDVAARGTISNPGFLAWCPDSQCLIVTDSLGEGKPDALFVVSLETREKRQLTNPQSPAYGDTNPAVSQDGRSLVFCRNLTYAASELYWLPLGAGVLAQGEPKRLTGSSMNAAYPAWMPDGQEVLFSSRGSLWKQTITEQSQPYRVPFIGEDGSMPALSRPAANRPARLVYVRSFSDFNIWRIATSSRAATPPAPVISSTRWDHNPQVAPDGKRIAFQSNRSGDMEIWLAGIDGSDAVQLTFMGASITAHPAWSPDGQTIAFDSNPEGQFEVYVVPVSGGKPRRVTVNPASDHYPSFSRDGRAIYFASNRAREYQLWKVSASGGDATQLTRHGGWVAVESLDGAHVYYTENPGSAPSPLWRLSGPDGQPSKVVEGIIMRGFALVQDGIYYLDQHAGENRLQFFDFTRGKSTIVARNLGEVGLGLAASPDGQAIFYTRVDSSVEDLLLVENFR
jgi:Tol biopolymer transport system component